MLRVIPSRNAKEYYTQSLKREDYYTEGQEISGNWQGIGAEKLGLSGPVTTEAFEQLCDNRKPGTHERLTQRTRADRVAGYDFNFHCPKSVSVVYEFTKDERILEAFKQSVNQTMREMEAEIKTRVRQKGANEDRTTGNMVWAEFVHFTARPVNGVPDPHLHAHCFAFNSTWDEIGEEMEGGEVPRLESGRAVFRGGVSMRGLPGNWPRPATASSARPKAGNWPGCRNGCWMSSPGARSKSSARRRNWASPRPRKRTGWGRSRASARPSTSPSPNCASYGTSAFRRRSGML